MLYEGNTVQVVAYGFRCAFNLHFQVCLQSLYEPSVMNHLQKLIPRDKVIFFKSSSEILYLRESNVKWHAIHHEHKNATPEIYG